MCNSWYNQKQQTVNCKREANVVTNINSLMHFSKHKLRNQHIGTQILNQELMFQIELKYSDVSN